MKKIFILIIKVYQVFISAFLPFNHCRFYPSCSQYAIEAIDKRGIIKGLWLSIKRILSCNPYSSKGGYDPVP